jgi:hypothetical protein
MLKAWFSNPNLNKLSDAEYKTMVDDYRAAFQSNHEVLLSELISLNFFQECRTEEEMALNNKAKELLCRLGIWRPENAERIILALLEVM